MAKDTRNKIASIHLNDETHQAMKRWSEITGLSMSKLAKNLLEEMQPVLAEMIKAYEDIESGKNSLNVLQNLMASGLEIAGNKLRQHEDIGNATDSGKGD